MNELSRNPQTRTVHRRAVDSLLNVSSQFRQTSLTALHDCRTTLEECYGYDSDGRVYR